MRHQIVQRFEFDYGHRILGHEGKCASLHGHRGVAEIHIISKELDNLGRVVDFGEVKNILGTWIDENWDHCMILHPDDPLLKLVNDLSVSALGPGIPLGYKDWMVEIFGPNEPYILGMNPTAENMALHLKDCLQSRLGFHKNTGGLKITQIRFWETPNCSAIATE